MAKQETVAWAITQARSTNDPDVLSRLATHRSPRVRDAVAANVASTDELILALSRDQHPIVLLTATLNAATRPNVDRELAQSENGNIRMVLANKYRFSRDSLPWDVQWKLAQDEKRVVRERTAESTNFADVFEHCMSDPDALVRASCARNPRADSNYLERLLRDTRAEVRASVAGGWHGRLGSAPTPDQLTRLAKDKSALVRYNVACRHMAPRAVWEELANDSDEMIRNEADRKLRGEGLPSEADVALLQPISPLGFDSLGRDLVFQLFEGEPFDEPPAGSASLISTVEPRSRWWSRTRLPNLLISPTEHQQIEDTHPRPSPPLPRARQRRLAQRARRPSAGPPRSDAARRAADDAQEREEPRLPKGDGALITHLLVREGGLEPPRPHEHTDLNRARLPIPPLAPTRKR
ncbi:hypothetical protein GCM10025780_20730 [Frondihabitans cladoniiphilus]|uniref:Leucine rich repeat variant n=1 Tax=Frondihabitans cladoniiphilus TaxID=715785 RepID=A0ABP8W0Z1_9MICO